MENAPGYAFPHFAVDEARRLELFQQRLDPLTVRRIERFGIAHGARCLEVGGGHGSITRWLAERVGPEGQVTATDLELDFLSEINASNVEVLRHDIRSESFPERTRSKRQLSLSDSASPTSSPAGSSTSVRGGGAPQHRRRARTRCPQTSPPDRVKEVRPAMDETRHRRDV